MCRAEPVADCHTDTNTDADRFAHADTDRFAHAIGVPDADRGTDSESTPHPTPSPYL
jgi:hypothetical protein